ncbi:MULTISPECIES: hypothetical protein [unclassified Methanoculleus]|jgi:hypothetical protein|uniref:Peptidase domain protein n=1 Tax=Methanoculleus palmolei TaxID=72612 RepID=A0ABD8A9F2_9EURY|nr:hypothetical protein [Methanoculleus sp. UBA377]MDD2472545.1 hypothetical protein [Methanoculleus sp.]WOX56107.1 hypothetical protein R6Y95_01930 [Methanoculleus palmolei]
MVNFGRIIGLLAVLVFIVPVASAAGLESENKEPLSEFVQTDGSAPRAFFTITQGETDYHGYSIPSGASSFSVDLNWFSDEYSLELGVFRPDGSQYGYYCDSDGDDNLKVRICLTISDPAPGPWTFTVHGKSVEGAQVYAFNAE